jgi:hypothetical protein
MKKDAALAQSKDCFGLTPGLSGSQLKIIGIIMMVFDHLHEMFTTQGAPLWFTWIGRPVLPLFLFLCAEGFAHTRNRKGYLLRLFSGFEAVGVLSFILTAALPNEDIMLINNVFQTLFFSALYMLFIDLFMTGIRNKQAKKIILAVSLMLFTAFVSLILTLSIDAVLNALNRVFPSWTARLIYTFIPNLIACEGGFSAVFMGALFYGLRKKRFLQILSFAVLSVVSLVMFVRAGNSPLSGSAQWLMIFALIPFMLYNGERGTGSKYFFYLFYPAHIYILYIIACLV